MNILPADKQNAIIAALTEGCSIRATVRMTGVCKKAVLKLLVDAGEVCTAYQDIVLRDLSAKRVQLDEVWTFNYCKARQVTERIALKVPHAGDVWLWDVRGLPVR